MREDEQEGTEDNSMTGLWKKKIKWKNQAVSDDEQEPLIQNYRSSTTLYTSEGPSNPDNGPDHIAQVQISIDEATNAAHNTIGKLIERGEDLEDLRQKS
ncbi:hypothetical protein HDV02_001593, partial [Globomyces sp. JEL0801]